MSDPAFDEFYRSEHLRVIRLLRRLGARWEEAWDVSQYCFLMAMERWETLSHPAQWIRTTALHEYWRLRARKADELPRLLRGGWDARPDFGKLDGKSQEEMVCAMIATLPPRQAEVMALTYDGYKPAEIARILRAAHPGEGDITPEAVRASLYQAREKLKRTLAAPEGV